MRKLSVKEEDLLQRIDEKEDLRPLFFRKVKGLKWFDSLYEKDYFNPAENPKPVAAKEEGYVNIGGTSILHEKKGDIRVKHTSSRPAKTYILTLNSFFEYCIHCFQNFCQAIFSKFLCSKQAG